MIATCHPLPRPAIEAHLRDATHALCARPEDTKAENEARIHRMVLSTMGFEPRDGLEYMLATLSFAHYEMILNSMRDVFQGQLEGMKARTKSTIVALDRSLLNFVRELRVTHKRPLADWAREAAEARKAAEQDAEAQAASAPDAVEPDAAETPPAHDPAPITRHEPKGPAAEPPDAPPDAPPAPQPSATTPSRAVSHAQPRPTLPLAPRPAQSASVASPPPEGGTPEENMAAFREALAAMRETIAEAETFEVRTRESRSREFGTRQQAPDEAHAAAGD